jgi:hypothetical protein
MSWHYYLSWATHIQYLRQKLNNALYLIKTLLEVSKYTYIKKCLFYNIWFYTKYGIIFW